MTRTIVSEITQNVLRVLGRIRPILYYDFIFGQPTYLLNDSFQLSWFVQLNLSTLTGVVQ